MRHLEEPCAEFSTSSFAVNPTAVQSLPISQGALSCISLGLLTLGVWAVTLLLPPSGDSPQNSPHIVLAWHGEEMEMPASHSRP